MNRALPVALTSLAVLAVVLALAWLVATAGLVPDDAVTLWAGAILAIDSQMPIGRIVAAYPTLPFLATMLLEFVTPRGLPTPLFLAAGVLAFLAGAWITAFRRGGLSLAAAALAALLLALHPAMLRAAISGPAEMMFAFFLFLFACALYDLRARSSAPEVMAVALALLGLTFSHPMGAAVACAAIPLLVFAVRPEMLASSVANLVIALIFPAAFCVGGFVYMSWVFPGSGWSFLVAPAEGLARWAADFWGLFGRGVTGSLPVDAGLAVLIATLIAAPLVPVALLWIHRLRPLVAPPLIIVATAFGAVWMTVATGMFGEPSAIGVLPPLLAAATITRVTALRARAAAVLALLALGWIGGMAALPFVDPRGATNVRAAIEGRGIDHERRAAISLGRAISGRDGVMVDTFNAPAVVVGRAGAQGLLSPFDEAFTLSVLFLRIDAPFVAVPDPQRGAGAQDRLNRAFPLLYRGGASGYRLIYDEANWRLFARI